MVFYDKIYSRLKYPFFDQICLKINWHYMDVTFMICTQEQKGKSQSLFKMELWLFNSQSLHSLSYSGLGFNYC
jgi:hypothetical protein